MIGVLKTVVSFPSGEVLSREIIEIREEDYDKYEEETIKAGYKMLVSGGVIKQK